MYTRRLTRIVSLGTLLMILTMSLTSMAQAYSPGNDAFNGAWGRTDRPVLDGVAARTWMWGPEATTQIMSEPYAESPNDERQVQYFDKSRMEITNPNGDSGSVWYVTNGLLVVELITGKMQVGDNSFESRNPAEVNVAGDFDDPTGPTYATFGTLLDESPRATGTTITERVDRQGVVTNDPALAGEGLSVSYVDNVTNHAIAAPFWDFMNSSGVVYQGGQYLNQPLFQDPFFATGRPITEAYWAEVKVGGAYKDVLMQCFERRCLTYTPGNPQGFIVEAGNVGGHYYEWRYGDTGNDNGNDNDNDNDNGNDGGNETPYEPATDYDFLTKFGLPSEGILIPKPNDVAASPSGDVYMTDTVNRRVLKFDAKGHFVTAWGSDGAGNGQFKSPRGIAVDSDGYVYVVDKNQNRVQKFDPNGAFILAFGETGSGNGQLKNPHDVAVTQDGRVYVSDQGNNRVQRFNTNGVYLAQFGATGNGNGQFMAPHGIDVSVGGFVYVADAGNDRVQIFDGDGVWQGKLGTAGNGAGQFGSPMSVAVAANGDVFVTDVELERVARFSPLPVLAPTNATTLQAVSYSFDSFIDGQFLDPTGADTDPNGRLIIADRGNDRIQIFANTSFTIGGPLVLTDTWVDGSRGRFSPGKPRSIAVGADGRVYATDGTSGQIKVFTTGGQFVTQYGPIVGNNLLAIGLQKPADVALDLNGNIYIADADLNKIIKLDPNGNYLAQFGETGTNPGQFAEPIAVTVDSDGNIYVADSSNYRVQKFGPDYSFITAWDSEMSAAGQVDIPIDVTVDAERVYVTFSNLSGRVEYFDHDGEFEGYFDGITSIGGVAVDDHGYIFVGDGEGQVQKFSPDGEFVAKFGREGTGDGEFTVFTALRVALDADGNVYVTDSGGQRVQVFAPAI